MGVNTAHLEFVDIYAKLVELADYGMSPKLCILSDIEKQKKGHKKQIP